MEHMGCMNLMHVFRYPCYFVVLFCSLNFGFVLHINADMRCSKSQACLWVDRPNRGIDTVLLMVLSILIQIEDFKIGFGMLAKEEAKFGRWSE